MAELPDGRVRIGALLSRSRLPPWDKPSQKLTRICDCSRSMRRSKVPAGLRAIASRPFCPAPRPLHPFMPGLIEGPIASGRAMSIHRVQLSAGLVTLMLASWSAAADIEPGLPPDAAGVLTINVNQLLHAPIVRQHIPPMLRQDSAIPASCCPTLAALGFNPLGDVDRVSYAFTDTAADSAWLKEIPAPSSPSARGASSSSKAMCRRRRSKNCLHWERTTHQAAEQAGYPAGGSSGRGAGPIVR